MTLDDDTVHIRVFTYQFRCPGCETDISPRLGDAAQSNPTAEIAADTRQTQCPNCHVDVTYFPVYPKDARRWADGYTDPRVRVIAGRVDG